MSQIILPLFFELRRPISNEHPLPAPLPLQMIAAQLTENIIQVWLLYLIRPFLQVDFRFQYQLIDLVWLSIDLSSFHLAEANLVPRAILKN